MNRFATALSAYVPLISVVVVVNTNITELSQAPGLMRANRPIYAILLE